MIWRCIFGDGSWYYVIAGNSMTARFDGNFAAWLVTGRWNEVTEVEQLEK